MIRFRRFSRRRQRAAMLVAALDRLDWGEPLPLAEATYATSDGLCVRCGTLFLVGDPIVLVRYGPDVDNYQGWAHEFCPDAWALLARTVERYDDKIITRIQPQGRGRAHCGHPVDGQPVYLVRQPVPLDEGQHSSWVCETCASPGGGEETT